MALTITKHSETFSSSQQLTPEDLAEVAALGFKTIINARPDNEGGAEQPTSASMQSAAEKAGLLYIHIPVVPNNIQPTDVAACASFSVGAPTPILGFCKSGMRATSLYMASQTTNNREAGVNSEKGLKRKISNFFQNRCLLTRLYKTMTDKI